MLHEVLLKFTLISGLRKFQKILKNQGVIWEWAPQPSVWAQCEALSLNLCRLMGKILWNYPDFWKGNSIPDELGLSRHCGFGEWGLLWSSPKKSNFWQTSWSRIMRKLGLKIQFQASITRRHFTQGSSSWLFLPMPQELVALLKVVYIYSSKFQLTVWSHELCQGKKNDRHLGIYDPLTKLKKITKTTTSSTQTWDESRDPTANWSLLE